MELVTDGEPLAVHDSDGKPSDAENVCVSVCVSVLCDALRWSEMLQEDEPVLPAVSVPLSEFDKVERISDIVREDVASSEGERLRESEPDGEISWDRDRPLCVRDIVRRGSESD